MAENRTKRIPGDFSTEGRLTKEPAKKNTKNGEEFVVFDIACNLGYGDNQETTFFSCSAFGSLVRLIEKAKKGSFVHVSGELSVETYQKNDGSDGTSYRIRCNSFRFLNTGNGEKKNEQTQTQQNYQGQQQYAPQGQAQPQQYQQQYAPQGQAQPQQYQQQYVPQGQAQPQQYQQQYAPQGQQYVPPQGQYQQPQQNYQGQQYASQQRQQPQQGQQRPQGQYQQNSQPQQSYSDYPEGYEEMPADHDLPF